MTPRERAGLFSLLGAAFLIRVLLVFSLRGQPYFDVPIVDSAAYDQWAWEIANKNFWGDRAFYQDPLYPYGLGIFYKLFTRNFLLVRLVQAAIGTFGLWMLFEAVRRFLGYRTAILALAIGAFTKTFLFYDTALLKEFLGVVAIEAALLFWSFTLDAGPRPKGAVAEATLPASGGQGPASRASLWKWLAFGAALGVGALVRGNLLLVVIAAAGFLAIRREWKPAGMVVAGAILCILPVTIRNAAVAKDFVLTTAQFGPNLYIGNNPENDTGRYRPPSFLEAGAPEFEEAGFRREAERLTQRPMKASEVDAFWRGRALDHIGGRFGLFLAVTFKRLLMLVSGFEIPDNYNIPFMARFSWVLKMPLFTFGLFTAPLAVAGMYLAWQERGRFAMLYVLLGAYAVSILFFFMFGRYRLPLVPILIVFAAHAVVKTAQLVNWQMRAVPRTAAIVFAAAFLLVNVPLPAAIGGYRDFRAAHYNLGIYYSKGDRPAEAAQEFEAAAKLNPEYLKDARFVWALGEAYEKSGQTPKALENYRAAVRLDPRSAEAPYRVGMIYFHEGMDERAAEMLSEAMRRDPKFAAAGGPLADAYRRLKRPDAALETLDAAIQAAPKDWRLRLKRAELFRELSMWKEALRSADEVLQLQPDQPAARKIRDEAARKVR